MLTPISGQIKVHKPNPLWFTSYNNLAKYQMKMVKYPQDLNNIIRKRWRRNWKKVALDYNIKNKISAVVHDNASNVKTIGQECLKMKMMAFTTLGVLPTHFNYVLRRG